MRTSTRRDIILLALVMAASVVGCQGEPPTKKKDAPPSPSATAPPGSAAGEGDPAPSAASDSPAPAAVESIPTPDPHTPDGLVAALERALLAVKACPRKPDSIRVADPKTCLHPVQLARAALKNPTRELAPDDQARKDMRARLAKVLVAALDDPDLTGVLYALVHHQADFDASDATENKLTALLDNPQEDIAQAAGMARFYRHDAEDTKTIALAKRTLDAHRNDRVRLAACVYLGDRAFRGNREHYELLLAKASNKDEASIVRGCAVSRLGFVGEDGDVKDIAQFLDSPMTQYAALATLQRGLATRKAFDTTIGWLEQNATRQDAALQWGALTMLLPSRRAAEAFPKARAVRALTKVVTFSDHLERVRTQAVKLLGKLEATKQLAKVKRKLKKSTAEGDVAVVKAIDSELGIPVAEPKAKP